MREQDPVCRGGFLCHEMGLGKTWMMSSLIKKNPGRTLVLTAKSTILGWCETLRAVGDFGFNVYEFKKPVALPDSPLVVVGTHQSILRHSAWMTAQRFSRVIVDEAHVMRNAGTRFTSKLLELAVGIPIRWGMTATPFNNSDKDIATYMRFLFPTGVIPDIKMFKWLMLRKTRAEVLPDGPKMTVDKHVFEFEHDAEREMYEWVSGRIRADQAWLMANANRVPMHVAGAMMLLLMLRQRQATIHPQLVLNAEKRWRSAWQQAHPVEDWSPERCTKLQHIVQMVEADQKDGKSTMVVTHFAEEITLLEQMLTRKGIRVKKLDGKTKLADRRALEKQPTGHAPQVVLLQIQAGGVGISLPWVHHVVNTSPDWNPFLERQAMYRAYRITTPHDVRVTQVYLNETIDGRIHDKQREKLMRSLFWTGDDEDTVVPFLAENLVAGQAAVAAAVGDE